MWWCSWAIRNWPNFINAFKLDIILSLLWITILGDNYSESSESSGGWEREWLASTWLRFYWGFKSCMIMALLIEISNLKIFCWIDKATLIYLISDWSNQAWRVKAVELFHFVVVLSTCLLKLLQGEDIHYLLIFTAWAPFCLNWSLDCLLFITEILIKFTKQL